MAFLTVVIQTEFGENVEEPLFIKARLLRFEDLLETEWVFQ